MDTQHGSRVFYGWIMVFAGLWVTLVIFGVVNSFSVFFKPLAHEFGWDRGLISLAYSLSWVIFGCLSIAAGRLVDRYGPHDRHPGVPRHVADDMLQRDVHLHQGLLHRLEVLASIGQPPGPLPQIAAEHAHLVGGAERAGQQATGMEPSQPLAVMDIVLGPPLDLLHLWRIDQ